MKRILFVIDSLNSGGAEKSLVSLLSLFDYKNNEVDLLMFSPGGLYISLLPKEVHILEPPNYFKKQLIGLKGLVKNKNYKEFFLRLEASLALRNPTNKKNKHAAQILWKYISRVIDKQEKKYDVAIAYSQGIPTYFVAEKVNANKKISWVNTDYKIAGYNKDFDKKYYDKINTIVAVSDLCRDVLVEEIPIIKPKVRVIYDILSPRLINAMATQEGGFADDYGGKRILTIGRLVYLKGYEMAIEACHYLKKQGYDIKWYSIGEGTLKSKLENMVKEYGLEDTFIFLGTHQNPYTFIHQCDIYVQPSRYEGFGLAIAEAKILKKPIAVTNFPVVHNQIRDRENGLIVNMNSEGIYEGIKEILENNNLKEKFKEKLSKENVGTEQEINKLYSIIKSGM